jgi:biopolymer transport protein ExbB/biopolymer transport protein TolQ
MASYSFASIAEKWLKYLLPSKQSEEFMSRITTALQRNLVEDAVNIAALYDESPVAVLVNASFQDCRTHWEAGIDSLEPSTQARQRAIVFVTERMKHGLWAIEALGWAVPLVSLFLTVSCVILALKGMRAAEGTGISAIAGGLAESLWPMAFAVLAAIPIVWSHKYLASKLGTLLLEGEKLSLPIIHDIVDRRHLVPSLTRQYATRGLDPRSTLKLTN